MFRLDGKIAIVTGASGGIGRAATMAYAESGADVAVLDKNAESLEALSEEVREKTGRIAFPVQCDVSDELSVKNAIEMSVDRFGKVDILFNNAGIAIRGSVETIPLEDWEKVMAVNLRGIFLLSKYVVPYMRKARYGKIINNSSVDAIRAGNVESIARHAYNASKSGVQGLTTSMASLYAKDNITVNAIAPGLFETGITSLFFSSEECLNMYKQKNPSGRYGDINEIKGPIIFLSSDASSYVTGQFICVDGGYTSM